MKECPKIQKELIAFIYDELEKDKQELLQNHIESCASCQQEIDRLNEVKIGADSFQIDIDKVMFSVDWDSLPAQVTNKVLEKEIKESQEFWLSRFIGAIFKPTLKPVYASLVVGILLGSVLTMVVMRTLVQKVEQKAQILMPQDYIERVELEMARRETLDYLNKSQYLILDFVQASSEEDQTLWQRKFASQRAKDLLTKKKYINRQLDTFQMVKAKEICNQVEFLFFELAQMTDQAPAWRLKEILDLIEDKQLLLKIKIIKKELEKSKKSEV